MPAPLNQGITKNRWCCRRRTRQVLSSSVLTVMRSTPIGIKPSTSPRTKTGAAAKKNGRRAFGPPFFRADSTRRTSHPKTTTRRCGHLKLPHLPSSPAELSTFRLVGQVRRRPKSLMNATAATCTLSTVCKPQFFKADQLPEAPEGRPAADALC